MTQGSTPPTTGLGPTGFDPARLIEQHQAGVWRYLRVLGCEPSLAEDLTQETFLLVLEKPFDDYNPAATAAYLRRVAHNLFITTRRRAGRVTTVEDVESLDSAWKEWSGDDNAETALAALRSCLEKLTDRARWALEMRFRDKLPRLEIATALEITEHGAKNLMQRAKQQLRQCVEKTMQ
ncbi:MAG: sigma-70 family RNA polymerase sigma factor [Pirellulaceae bacterium]